MKDFDLRLEKGEIHMPEVLAVEAGFEAPFEYNPAEVSFEKIANNHSIVSAQVAADRASEKGDPVEWTRQTDFASKLRLRNQVMDAMTDLVVENALDSFDRSFIYYFGPGGENELSPFTR